MPQCNVVITGVGVVSSIGTGGDVFFQSLLDKRSGITSLANRTDDGPQPAEDSQPAGLWIGGPLREFNAKQYVRPRKALKVMSREIQIAFAASQMAIEHAGLDSLVPASAEGPLKPASIGTVFGTEMFYGPPAEMEDAMRACTDGDGAIDPSLFGHAVMKNLMPLWMLKYLPNMPACHVGISINAQGPNNSIVLGDVSGPAAVIEAASCLERGPASIMLAGSCGTRINTTRMNYSGDLPIADVYCDLERSSRPFDPKSQGVVGGEGAATVVLETLEQVTARAGKPLAIVRSYASRFVPSQNMKQGKRRTDIDEPNLRGSRQAIQMAIRSALTDAQIEPNQIGLVVSHAMGDPVMDQQEREALMATVPDAPVIATMAAIGHTGAAAGMMSVAAATLAITHRKIPPTARTETTSAEIQFVDQETPLDGDYVLVITHTSNGNATALVLSAP
ncbi:MAG: beta-ketoacyl-[acyl-carrier-protein] synthase family protein [Rubripirellula sp.]